MMGPEAMGVANANLVWSDEKVCRNFLCGTCPHTLFTNTVSETHKITYPVIADSTYVTRKWTSAHAPSHTLNG